MPSKDRGTHVLHQDPVLRRVGGGGAFGVVVPVPRVGLVVPQQIPGVQALPLRCEVGRDPVGQLPDPVDPASEQWRETPARVNSFCTGIAVTRRAGGDREGDREGSRNPGYSTPFSALRVARHKAATVSSRLSF